MGWLESLRANPLTWLLEPDDANPGVRLFALTELLGYGPQHAEVREAQEAVMRSGAVPAILDAQYPEGFWVKPGGGYSPKYRSTVWQIMFLAELGADPQDERVRRGCEYVMSNSMAGNGAFSAAQKPVPSSAIHCLNGNLVAALIRLGFGDDPRVKGALDWIARSVVGAEPIRYYRSGTMGPGFACSANGGLPCGWGANKAMRALLAVPESQRTPILLQAVQAGVQFLLSRDPALADYPYIDRVSSTWFKLGFPLTYWSDVLETLAVLAQAGLVADPRLDHALRLILDRQDARGRWKLENSLRGRMWTDIERQGQPSKWVTLRVLRVLRDLDQGQQRQSARVLM